MQRPTLCHSLRVTERQGLGSAVEQFQGQLGEVSDVFQPNREDSCNVVSGGLFYISWEVREEDL